MLAQDAHVTAVGAEHHVEHVARNRHHAEHAVDRDIAEHAREHGLRRAELVRLVDDVERQRRGDDVAKAGRETDQAVRAEPKLRERDHKARVEQARQPIDAGDALGAACGAGIAGAASAVCEGCGHGAPEMVKRARIARSDKIGTSRRGNARVKLNAMTATSPATDYPLYFRDGAGFVWSIETRGLKLDDNGITFTSERETRTIRFSEIRSVRLHTAYANAGETPLGICQIGFRRFRKLTVLSGDAHLRVDETQRAAYHAFVRDFHRRIPPADRARIPFNGGLSDTRYFILCTALLAGALLFGLLPLVLIFVAPSWHTLGVAAASWGLAYAGWKSWARNRPRSYAPDRIPDDLLP